MTAAASPHVFDATTAGFEEDVLRRSLQTPVLVDFWAEWCGPCKQFGPILEKLAAEYNGAFLVAKVDVDKEPQIAGALQVRSIPTVFLVKDGQLVDGFPGALPEGQLREFLTHHGIEPAAAAPAEETVAPAVDVDPQEAIARLRADIAAAPDRAELSLDLALLLIAAGEADEAQRLLDALPANLATDDRTQRARARLQFLALLRDAPAAEALQARVDADPGDLRARHLLGAWLLASGQDEAGLEQFLEMLRRDREFEGGLPKKAMIDAFRVVEDPAVVGQYRRKMAALLF